MHSMRVGVRGDVNVSVSYPFKACGGVVRKSADIDNVALVIGTLRQRASRPMLGEA